ncbi:MAG: DUF4838 domain-containing protein [Candidatus Omnitrophica bacterium]|nr:DUF4838 domain-containing protein [Candidatus Omnitrophota bacterium]
MKPANPAMPCAFETRGVVLTPADLTLKDWPERAARAGLTTIALHLRPSVVEKFVDSPEGKEFLAKCARLGLNVEYELHALGELLPRNLFAKEPDLFRMNEVGVRTPDVNLSVHSVRALEIASSNALRIAQKLRPTIHRYYFRGDDSTKGWCHCPKCRQYSASEQALIYEDCLVAALRKVDSQATLAHLAYATTVAVPVKVKPAPGIFLEFAPISHEYDRPFAQQTNPRFGDTLQALRANLKVFPVETAQVLEYWLDVSRFSRWRLPHQKLPWRPEVMAADAQTYAQLGIRNVTTFAVYIDANYFAQYGEPTAIQEYGDILRATPLPTPSKTYTIARVPKPAIQLDGRLDEPEWKQAVAETGSSLTCEEAKAPPTVFRALIGEEYLYFAFEVHDETPLIAESFPDKLTVAKEDRVELFFAPDNSLAKYL